MKDKVIEELIAEERVRQNEGIELIASENYPSSSVMEAQGSILTAKYAEGYPGKRYYGGCRIVDDIEIIAIQRAKRLFNALYANVQPHSGSQANFAAYRALMPNGGKVLSLTLNDGGHLTHGSPVSFSKHLYEFAHYPLGEDGKLDYEIIEKRMEEEKPDVLLAGYSAYPYDIDFKRLRALVDGYNRNHERKCFFMVDMAHIAGIVAAGLCQNPVEYADVVTSTTHKTLRGPRGGLILSNDQELGKKLNSAVFPYAQGGPLEHVIAGKAVAFLEDMHPSFKDYMRQVLENTKAAATRFKDLGRKVSGTDNHLFLLNVLDSYGLTGKEAETLLEKNGITANKNMIHGDTLPPMKTSGLRIGFAALTSRGCKEKEAISIADLIDEILNNPEGDYRAKALAIAGNFKDVTALEYPTPDF